MAETRGARAGEQGGDSAGEEKGEVSRQAGFAAIGVEKAESESSRHLTGLTEKSNVVI